MMKRTNIDANHETLSFVHRWKNVPNGLTQKNLEISFKTGFLI